MTFTLDTVKWLASDAGAALLERLAGDDLSNDNTLRLLTLLRRDLPPERAGAALELARLRVKAVGKFGTDAAKMFFTREALEQASDPLIRKHRYLPSGSLDVCCGIGSDSLESAKHAYNIIGYDIDPIRVLMANLNANALGVSVRYEGADVTQITLESSNIFFDPGRRDKHSRRIFDVEAYQPPLSLVRNFRALEWEAKLSPGVDLTQLQPYLDSGLTWVDFVSVRGELKEVDLHYSLPNGGIECFPTAVLFTEDDWLTWFKAHETSSIVREPRGWLVEPDPALIRAGLVAEAAQKFDGAQLDESIAYFTTDAKPESAWVRAWRILDWTPFNAKKLREYLRERGVGTVTVKKRGTAVTPEVLIPQLKLKGSESRTLVLTRYAGKQIVLICEDIAP